MTLTKTFSELRMTFWTFVLIEGVREETINNKGTHFQKFLGDYEKIEKLGGWEKEEELTIFSNKVYDEVIGRKWYKFI